MQKNAVAGSTLVVYPNTRRSWLSLGLLLVCGPLLLLALSGSNRAGALVPGLFMAGCGIIYAYHRNKRVVFDNETGTVKRITLFAEKAWSVADIHGVSKVNTTLLDYYILTTKADPYGQGVQLSENFLRNQAYLRDFEANSLPYIRAFIGKSSQKQAAATDVPASDEAIFTFYKPNGTTYYFYDLNSLLIGVGAALFLVSGWWLLHYDLNNWRVFRQSHAVMPLLKLLAPVWLMLSLLIFGRGVLRIRLNVGASELARELLFGLLKRRFRIVMPPEFWVQSNRTNGQHTETDVHLKVQNKNGWTTLKHFRKTGQVEPFIKETKRLLSRH